MIFENLAQIAYLEKDTNENFKIEFFYGKRPFKESETRFSISSRHRTDPINNIWKSPLGDPQFILLSIYWQKMLLTIVCYQLLDS